MPSCVMRFCTNYSTKTTKDRGITYHSFPTNEMRRLRWIEIVRHQRKEEDWLATTSSKICSDHFLEADKYESSGNGFILLKKTALPVIETPFTSKLPPASPSREIETKFSVLESLPRTSREASLQSHIRKMRIEKIKLASENKTLKSQNERLKKKVARMRVCIKHLRKTNSFFIENLRDE